MWQNLAAFKEIIAVAASVVAVVAGIVAVLAFFATKTELYQVRCEALTGLQLQEANTELLEAEQTIFNAKVTRNYLIKKGAESTEIIKVEQIISSKENARGILLKEQSDLANKLASPECKM